MKYRLQIGTLVLSLVLMSTTCSTENQSTDRSNQSAESTNSQAIAYNDTTIEYISMGQFMRDVSRYGKEAAPAINNQMKARLDELSPEELNEINKMYGMDYRNLLDGRESTRSCTFSLHRLKNFIADIEEKAEAAGYTDDREVGITWTYAIYDQTQDHLHDNKDYRLRHTLYGVPTVKTDSGVFTFDVLSGMRLIDLMAQTSPAQFREPISALNADAFNLGYLCPPTCEPPGGGNEIDLSDDYYENATFLSKE